MHPGLIPPDAAQLPSLPERFAWALPHVKQHRRPTPTPRQIVIDGEGPAVASVDPAFGSASVLLGVHRWIDADRHRRTFETRDRALSFAARWAWLYREQLIAEVEAVRRHNAGKA